MKKEAYITVDHRKDWKTYVYNKTSAHQFTDDKGHCWEGHYKKEVASAYNDPANLVALCSSCNAKKNGPKFYDGGDPTRYLGKKGADDEKE